MGADTNTALLFAALALTTAIYMKLGQRSWRITLVMVAVPVLVAVVAIVYQTYPTSLQLVQWESGVQKVILIRLSNSPAMLPTMISVVLTAAFLFSPSLLESPRGGLTRRFHLPGWPKVTLTPRRP